MFYARQCISDCKYDSMTGKFVSVREEGQDFYGCFEKFDDFKVQDVRVSDTNLHDQRQMEGQEEQVI